MKIGRFSIGKKKMIDVLYNPPITEQGTVKDVPQINQNGLGNRIPRYQRSRVQTTPLARLTYEYERQRHWEARTLINNVYVQNRGRRERPIIGVVLNPNTAIRETPEGIEQIERNVRVGLQEQQIAIPNSVNRRR